MGRVPPEADPPRFPHGEGGVRVGSTGVRTLEDGQEGGRGAICPPRIREVRPPHRPLPPVRLRVPGDRDPDAGVISGDSDNRGPGLNHDNSRDHDHNLHHHLDRDNVDSQFR